MNASSNVILSTDPNESYKDFTSRPIVRIQKRRNIFAPTFGQVLINPSTTNMSTLNQDNTRLCLETPPPEPIRPNCDFTPKPIVRPRSRNEYTPPTPGQY
ncbi:uncharacterized protein OCT59_004928 [Rhizophagus irregularis]|uniref:Uncharacterized protein n=2 Tax=Rhizophagus irregularis TaxID=588596 RepID=U9TDG3_RHIID|nr:hypothetical protein GLOIN_2v1511444 [Rhizophagus irregularis DAOM 181602=DAOM 197198]EXX79605.1 hypothetical protein RirG_003970 [Rhizophagus irregularis DAOM 197198w]POG80880.1 hypothetical protein GLOIN_2v1511444 [Rhizophagus irregularis DAOM 181602=DAOM 197198]UZO13429.1 hypothetical protein OCT59_004928 [Rhizophagus irregularis]|eukprot:XP_025187746.1 hypothetical protein GLOIN_2v1511444 [Rhizophagus irregularis DAOM 181602=DAOM 197198]